MRAILRVLTAVVACGVLTTTSAARDYFVDQANPKADDKAAGTIDSPLKTVQAALDRTQAGDNVEVRAGVYHEAVTMRHSGGHFRAVYAGYWADPDPKYITLEPYKDERAVLDGSVTVPADKWELVTDRKNTYVAPFASQTNDNAVNMVFSGETLLMPALTKNPDRNQPDTPFLPTMPGDGDKDQGYYYDKAQKKLYVNLGGPVPGRTGELTVAQLGIGVDAHDQTFIRIRKLEIRRFNQWGVVLCNASESILKDCFIHYCGLGINCGQSAGPWSAGTSSATS